MCCHYCMVSPSCDLWPQEQHLWDVYRQIIWTTSKSLTSLQLSPSPVSHFIQQHSLFPWRSLPRLLPSWSPYRFNTFVVCFLNEIRYDVIFAADFTVLYCRLHLLCWQKHQTCEWILLIPAPCIHRVCLEGADLTDRLGIRWSLVPQKNFWTP